ncbi:hypothetical protein [Lacticaseibacillus nasuensis]|uniref:hypothetical protein n=1 Tax=Lacticaseibacillus nasuensis TaxID=944671 RepID=UPI0006D2A0A5|nr:hypothetical protein [Lacticaseibacillus nasuensis]
MVKITPSNVKKVLGGGANVIAALGTISGVVGNQVKQSLEDHHEHHKDDFPLPDLREVPLADAQQVLTNNELLWSLLPVAPAIKYASAQPNVVLATVPKPRAKIAPQGFVKVYYATPETVAASAELLAAQAAQRQAKKSRAAGDDPPPLASRDHRRQAGSKRRQATHWQGAPAPQPAAAAGSNLTD